MYCCHDNKISQQNPNVVNFKIMSMLEIWVSKPKLIDDSLHG